MDFDELCDRVIEAIDATDLARAGQLLERIADEDFDDADEITDTDEHVVSRLWEDLADAYADRSRYDQAIATIERCRELDYAADHDLRGALAGYRLRAGDETAAVELWDAIKNENPDDVWVPFLAAVAYQDLERQEDALPWFDEALETVLRRGDHEGLLADILELRDETLTEVGREPDELQERGRALFGQQVRQRPVADPVVERRVAAKPAFAWFPPTEWKRAVEQWPAAAQGHEEYQSYVRDLQAQLLAFEESEGTRPSLAPLFIEAYSTWAEAQDRDPGAAATGADYAAEVVRIGNEVPWPPRRNEPCWCGSGAKYKKCCATVTAGGADG